MNCTVSCFPQRDTQKNIDNVPFFYRKKQTNPENFRELRTLRYIFLFLTSEKKHLV